MNKDKHQDTEPRKAVIYCRVSSKAQTKRGDGLGSQESRCREYAAFKNFSVEHVFIDDVTGKLAERPGMQAMLAWLRQHRKDGPVVIIDDISRFARGVEAHITLRKLLASAGGTLKSPSIEFGEDSDSRLVEYMLATMAQHQREKNGEQTINRMRGRLQNGYWVFQAPMGYRYERAGGHGKMLVRDEPVASILQEALEGYASGRFETQVEVKRFLERQPDFPKDLNGCEVRNQRVYEFLTRAVYAGYVESPNWGISLRKGHHEGLIDFETFEKIQARLTGTAKAPARKNISADFPLRGFILCNDCGNPLTSCWSQGKNRKYPYYLCATKGCASYRKSIKREELEGEFEDVLQRLEPSESLFALVKAMFRDAWDMRLRQASEIAVAAKANIKRLEKQIDQLMDRIVDASSDPVIAAYEKRIARLEREKVLAVENLEKTGKPKHTFEESFGHAMAFLSSPWNIWKNADLIMKKVVLRLAFAGPVPYCRNQGLRTPNYAFPFKVLDEICNGKCEMARRRGFEPLT